MSIIKKKEKEKLGKTKKKKTMTIQRAKNRRINIMEIGALVIHA